MECGFIFSNHYRIWFSVFYNSMTGTMQGNVLIILRHTSIVNEAYYISMNINAEQAADKTAIRPFHVNNVPEAELTELRRRINATKWPERETVPDASQGVQLATIQALARYWATDYDGQDRGKTKRPSAVHD